MVSSVPPEVQICLKNPSRTVDDFEMSFPLSSTIGNLKLILQEVYPGTPPAANQKIIFAGRLLQDDDRLDAVLANYDTSQTQSFHIVVRTTQQRPVAPPSEEPRPPQVNAVNQAEQLEQLRFMQQEMMRAGMFPQVRMDADGNPVLVHAQPRPANEPAAPAPQIRRAPGGLVDPPQGGAAAAAAGGGGGFQLGLLLKLALFCYIFSDGGIYMTGFIFGFAIAYYLYATGWLRGRLVVNIGGGGGGAAAAGQEGAAGGEGGGAPTRDIYGAVPYREGPLGSALTFFSHLVLSILPFYRAERAAVRLNEMRAANVAPHPPADEPAAAAAGAAAAAAAAAAPEPVHAHAD